MNNIDINLLSMCMKATDQIFSDYRTSDASPTLRMKAAIYAYNIAIPLQSRWKKYPSLNSNLLHAVAVIGVVGADVEPGNWVPVYQWDGK